MLRQAQHERVFCREGGLFPFALSLSKGATTHGSAPYLQIPSPFQRGFLYVPVGQSTNLASRMETLATPGSVLVSEYMYKLTEGYFEFKPLGPAQIKGFPDPIHVYEVLGVGPLRTR